MALYLALIHALFLSAVSLRLGRIGYSGKRIIRLCMMSLSLWPLILLVGIVAKLPVFRNYGGLTAIIAITFVYYLTLEAKVLLEREDERAERLDETRQEEARHRSKVADDEKVIAEMFSIKSYVGDANSLNAISDLGKLNDAGIPCRIEGGIVKMLYVRTADIARVEKTIDIDSHEADQSSAMPP
jgi:hypothetical protein